MARRATFKEVLLPLTRDDIEARSAQVGDPVWMHEKRIQAWEIAESLPMPTTSDEPWRRTDIRALRWDEALHIANSKERMTPDIPGTLTTPLIGDEQGGLLIFVDGKLARSEVSESIAQQGVIFSDLQMACQAHPDLVQEYFMTQAVRPEDGKFAALHAALWSHGVLLYVPSGVHVDLPFHSVEYLSGQETISTHILVVLEEGASATYLHESVSPEHEAQAIHLGATELLVGNDADLRYVSLQNWGEHVYSFGHQRGRVARGGRLDWVAGEMGTRLSKVFMTLDLDGDDSWGRISGLYFAHGRQHLDLDTQQNHHALRTTSDLLFKGALKGKSRAVWQGMIVVDPGAQRTDGFQANRNLLLERSARADSIPGLEIKADDVRCTHAATVGKVDESEIFYLMSRGIPREQAIELIVEGFFDALMQRIPFEGVRERLVASIDHKLKG